MWPCKNKYYFLQSCSIFLNFKLLIQSIILRHTSVENINHVKTFLLSAHFNDFSHIFELRFRALKKTCPLKLSVSPEILYLDLVEPAEFNSAAHFFLFWLASFVQKIHLAFWCYLIDLSAIYSQRLETNGLSCFKS